MSRQSNEQEQRNRPASADSTRERGILYRRLSDALGAISMVLLVFFVPVTGPDPERNILGIRLLLQEQVPGTIFFVLYAACVAGALFLRKKSRRHVEPRFVELEQPPKVLFLRPFKEDTDFKVYASWGNDRLPTGIRQSFKVMKFQLHLQREAWRKGAGAFEFGEILEEITRSFGNVAAIGEPGSPPILGADNVYVSDDTWQKQVLGMAKGADLVILTTGTSRGVTWEIENMLKIVPASKLILNVPGMTPARRRKNYSVFRETLEHLFPKGLPEKLLARAMSFNDDWTPNLGSKIEPPTGTASNVVWWMSRVLP